MNNLLPILLPLVLVAVYALAAFSYFRWYFRSNKLFDRFVRPGMINYKMKTLLLITGIFVVSIGFLATILPMAFYADQPTNLMGVILGGEILAIALLFGQVFLLFVIPGLVPLGLVILSPLSLGWYGILAVIPITASLYFSAVHAVDALIERVDQAGYSQLALQMRSHQRVGLLAFIAILFKPLMFFNIFRRVKTEGELDILTSFNPVASWETAVGKTDVRRIESTTVTLPSLEEDRSTEEKSRRKKRAFLEP